MSTCSSYIASTAINNKLSPFEISHSTPAAVLVPRHYILLLPGAGGFSLDFQPEKLYSSVSLLLLDSHVITITFNADFHYDHVRRNIVRKLVGYLLALPGDAPIFMIGWSFSAAVVLEVFMFYT